jgi:hypothetical protein
VVAIAVVDDTYQKLIVNGRRTFSAVQQAVVHTIAAVGEIHSAHCSVQSKEFKFLGCKRVMRIVVRMYLGSN